MAEEQTMRINQVARKLNVGISTLADFLSSKGFEVDSKPNSKITMEQFQLLAKEFKSSAMDKEEASGLTIGAKRVEDVVIDDTTEVKSNDEEEQILIKNLSTQPAVEEEKIKTESPKLQGIKVLGKIDLDKKSQPAAEKSEKQEEKPKGPIATPKEAQAPTPIVKEEVVAETPKEKERVQEEKAADPVKEAPELEPAPKAEVVEKKPEEVTKAETPAEQEAPKPQKVIEAKAQQLRGLKVIGKIELPKETDRRAKPVASSDENKEKKKKRKRISKPNDTPRGDPRRSPGPAGGGPGGDRKRGGGPAAAKKVEKKELTDKEIQEKIKATLAKLSTKKGGDKTNRSKYRREKRSAIAEAHEEEMIRAQEDAKVLKVAEFVSANDMASLMDVSVNEVISTCMSLGMFVSINQRLDAEAITVIADEFNYTVDFTSTEDSMEVKKEEDLPEDLQDRAPIVTIMGHVDHGKTSLLDFIRDAKVTATESGGITQHIGAYDVMTSSGKRIAFLDTPGHEAFTAMRARGAKVTDIVIIVVAADDNVMPQTKEAINHAQVAGVPIVIAINKMDKAGANPDKIKEELSQINILVEDWGGKYQCQTISAKTGQGIDDLLEKVLLEAEMLELKANPDKNANGTVVEASLDKGRGYVTTVLIQEGTLRVGDMMLAGAHYGKVKAMYDHRGRNLKEAPPATPVQVLGLDGAPQAGDKINVMDSDKEAREMATKRAQILREQSMRTKKHITLDEIGRRLAIGSFKELNVIVKGDVDGSIEALSDSLLKLSTGEVQVNIIHKAVGQISESDVLLASASDAVIVGFQVRPSTSARRLAENEEIEIRLYSIIYDAINDVKDAMEGMLAPTVEEVITGNAEVRDVFKITKVGTVAGCYVTDGNIKRNNKVRLIRDGIVVYTGDVQQLRRFKDDVAEVKSGYECGISIKNFNDIKEGDVFEGFAEKEVKRTL